MYPWVPDSIEFLCTEGETDKFTIMKQSVINFAVGGAEFTKSVADIVLTFTGINFIFAIFKCTVRLLLLKLPSEIVLLAGA